MADELPETPRPANRRYRAVVAVGLFAGLLSLGGWWAGRDLAPKVGAAPRRTVGGARLFDQVREGIAVNSRLVQRGRELILSARSMDFRST